MTRTTWYPGVNYLDSLTLPGSFGSHAQNHRIKWPEFHSWRVDDTTLVAIKLEDDGDLHLRLRSSAGKTMIAEIPRPGCVGSSPLWKTGITAARNYATGRYWVSLTAGATSTRKLTSSARSSGRRSLIAAEE